MRLANWRINNKWIQVCFLGWDFSRLGFKTHLRPIPTKWETSRKISFPSYNQIHVVQTLSFKMIYYMSVLLPIWVPKTHYFLEKFLCFLLIIEIFNILSNVHILLIWVMPLIDHTSIVLIDILCNIVWHDSSLYAVLFEKVNSIYQCVWYKKKGVQHS